MTIYYLLNENNEIVEDGFHKFDDNCLEIEQENYNIKRGYSGNFFFESYMNTEEYIKKEAAFTEKQKLTRLREKRKKECFPIINRGKLWYDRLTNEQLNELLEWYQSWLDVTDTFVVPESLSWLI